VWTVLVTILGSRGPLLSGALACAGSALVLFLVPIQVHGGNLPLIACLAINGLLANAVQTSMYALATHVYPTSIRATGVAYAATIGRAGGLLSSLFGSYLIQDGGGAYWLALAFAMVLAFAGLAWVRSHYPGIQQLDALERSGAARH
jgi:AAHS family 4-hydroxybenzoate transporter-like MFS transporter